MTVALLSPGAPPDAFPLPSAALDEPNGLLAVGGDLGVERLLYAYRNGIFPWYSDGQPPLWWSPDPRAVLWPERMHVSRSLRKRLRRTGLEVRVDSAFTEVVAACAAPRPGSEGTWITPEMARAYTTLHRGGYAHSFEVWEDDTLVGGLYGVALGGVFFGESMFSQKPDTSKVALFHLTRAGYALIDCQLPNPHLTSLGAELIPRKRFLRLLDALCSADRDEAGRAGGPRPPSLEPVAVAAHDSLDRPSTVKR